jgi:Transposase DDE domain group 1
MRVRKARPTAGSTRSSRRAMRSNRKMTPWICSQGLVKRVSRSRSVLPQRRHAKRDRACCSKRRRMTRVRSSGSCAILGWSESEPFAVQTVECGIGAGNPLGDASLTPSPTIAARIRYRFVRNRRLETAAAIGGPWTSCHQAEANQFRLFLHAGAYWLLWSLRQAMPRRSTWRVMQFDMLRLCLIKVAARVVELNTQVKVHLPTSVPD